MHLKTGHSSCPTAPRRQFTRVLAVLVLATGVMPIACVAQTQGGARILNGLTSLNGCELRQGALCAQINLRGADVRGTRLEAKNFRGADLRDCAGCPVGGRAPGFGPRPEPLR